MVAIAVNGTHSGRTKKSMVTAPPVIMTVAVHLAERRTTPPRRQSRMCGPMRGWLSSQFDSRGELRAAAQAASRTKGTVGMMGRKVPMMASARLTTASALSSQRAGRDRGRSGGGSLGGVAFMPGLCRPALCLRP